MTDAPTPVLPSRRALLALATTGALALALPDRAVAQALTGGDRSAAIDTVTRAANAVRLLQGRFEQTNPDGSRAPGAFWLQRPGRLRFEYDAPSPLLMVVDGQSVALRDRRLNSTNRFPLRATALWFLLKDDINLSRDVNVTGVERRDGVLFLAMRDRRREADGELTLAFREADSQLQGWTVRDRQNRVTQVRLTEARPATRFDPQLFILPQPRAAPPPKR